VDGLLDFYECKDERRKINVQVKGGGEKRGDVARRREKIRNQRAEFSWAHSRKSRIVGTDVRRLTYQKSKGSEPPHVGSYSW
jgi:hypothetical protein